MNRRWGNMALAVISLLIALMPEVVMCDDGLTDPQKKEIVYGMYDNYRKEFPQVREISPRVAMKEMVLGKILFVDTRKPEEMAVSMLPGAISEEQFLKDPGKFKEKRIVVYCTISYRSGKFAQEMAKADGSMFTAKSGTIQPRDMSQFR